MKEEKAMRMEEKGRKQKRSMKKANLLENKVSNTSSIMLDTKKTFIHHTYKF